jgi:DNA-binding SARP family transcriptional activator
VIARDVLVRNDRKRESGAGRATPHREKSGGDAVKAAPGRFTLRLLGPFELSHPQRGVIHIGQKKAEALLAFLALQTRPASREVLADLLWGETAQEQARQSLRQALSAIRRAAGEDLVVTTRETVALNREWIDVDVSDLESAASGGDPEAITRVALRPFAEMGEGLLLDEERFDFWLGRERERTRELLIAVKARRLEQLAAAGQTEAAVLAALDILSIEPTREATHRELMRLYARLGRRDAAVRQYITCTEVLRRRLGVTPEPATRALHDEIRDAVQAGETAAVPRKGAVLVVEDDPASARILGAMLASRYDLVHATDGAAALLELGRRRFDAILLDLGLPRLGGFDVLETLKQVGIDTPVLVMTTATDPETEARALDLGVAEFVHKPLQQAVLLRRLERVLRV